MKRQFSNNFVIIVGISLMSFHETSSNTRSCFLIDKKNSILFFVEDKISSHN